jgi:hypothetical protein
MNIAKRPSESNEPVDRYHSKSQTVQNVQLSALFPPYVWALVPLVAPP